MALIYITGVPGAGKSTIEHALRRLGRAAYDADVVGAAFNNETGQVTKVPPLELRSPEWFKAHSWKLRRHLVEKLKRQARDQPVFLCGTASNEDEMRDLFDLVILLDIDRETLKLRISGRQDNDYGKNEYELNEILRRHAEYRKKYNDRKVIIIDARRPVNVVVGEILRKCVNGEARP